MLPTLHCVFIVCFFSEEHQPINPSAGGPTPITSISELSHSTNNDCAIQTPSCPDILRDGYLSHSATDINTSVSTIMPYATTIGFIRPEQDPSRTIAINNDIDHFNQNNNNAPYDKLFQTPKSPTTQNVLYPGGQLYLNQGESWDQRSVHLYQQLPPEYRYFQ